VNRALGLLVAAIVAGCANPAPSETSVSVASPGSSPTDASAPLWQLVELPNADRANLLAIGATAHDVVIVGGRNMAPAAWSSHDGGPWVSEPLAPEVAFPGNVVALGDRMLAVGGNETNRCAHPFATFFWVRDPSGRWTAAPFDRLFCAGGSGVAAVSGGMAAILGTGTGDVPFSWFSDDGLTWVARPIRRDVFPVALAPAGDGFAALGKFVDDGWWFGRNDGRAGWTLVRFANIAVDAQPVGLVDTGRGLIAWFVDPAGQPVAFVSETGASWEPVKLDGLADVVVERVGQTPAGYVLLGLVDAGPRLFLSRDGVNWRNVPGPSDIGQGLYHSIAFSGGRAYLLATVRDTGDEGFGAVWAAPAALFQP
jgi:hypothetical protein